jgi:hypothetical protein
LITTAILDLRHMGAAGSTKLGPLLLVLPIRVLTPQQVISSEDKARA